MNTKAWSHSQKVAGLITLAAMLLAFVLDNSPAEGWYGVVHHLPVMVRVGTFAIDKPLILWINDGLMVFFFLLIALELKREILEGQLSTLKSIATPAFAALGGMAAPALIYTAFNAGDPVAMRGWAIPTATDTVLALTVLVMLGSRVPASLKVFLTALAIFDDLGAILIIALFYTERLATPSLILAAFGIVALIGLNVYKVTRTAAYVVVGVFLWIAVLKSGVHATLAGVAIGLAIPMKLTQDGRSFSPLRETEHQLYPWVALGVVPVFAFFNSGIVLSVSTVNALVSPTSLGIVLGLLVGKQVGIFGAVWLAVQLGVAKLPEGTNWWHLYGVALLAGIGFTMSLFIAGLAFSDSVAFRSARLSVVVGSLLSAAGGVAVLRFASRKRRKTVPKQVEPFP
ncbi:MAG: Na+/H+ antiporter NhaA [Sulfuriferula multivorans]|uniref:Na(+)/H(+) antiporter NhaA n=1 Tax=Sulfuriferula multivorans TaxID=1559896 RepID=A0A7C9TD22_9PROT|nr:Na+/H+ antiporter NhaA [Sulfuriferula multivorans]